jgi:gluconolactonase
MGIVDSYRVQSRILKILDGAVSVALSDAGTDGLAVDTAGNLLAARFVDGSIVRLDLANPSNIEPLAATYDDAPFNGPRDVVVRSDGNVYFTDARSAPADEDPQIIARVYRIAPGSGVVSVVDAFENGEETGGLTLSLDEQNLLVSTPPGLMRYPINADGSTQPGLLLEGGPLGLGGIVVDCAGNLYLAYNSVRVFDANFQEIDRLETNEMRAFDLTFGGPEHKTLFMAEARTATVVSQIELNIPGKP